MCASPAGEAKALEILEFSLNLDRVKAARELRLSKEEVGVLAEEAKSLIHPRALFKESFIDKKEIDAVFIEQVEFRSRVMAENMKKVQKVFPFILTIGGELEKKAAECGDLLHQYRLEIIGDLALEGAAQDFERNLKIYGIKKYASLSPGSLDDWPITDQPKLFSILEGGRPIGVRLTESMLMIPRKSLSGIYFPTEIDFKSCRLCPRKDCQGRRAAYDPRLRKKFGLERPRPR